MNFTLLNSMLGFGVFILVLGGLSSGPHGFSLTGFLGAGGCSIIVMSLIFLIDRTLREGDQKQPDY